MEILADTDLVIAASSATFALPEVKIGVVAIAGALPRIVRTIGRQRAMEMALTGRTVSTEEAHAWGLVNHTTADARVDVDVLERPVVQEALRVAEEICENSPDAVIVSREGVKLGWEGVGAEEASARLVSEWGRKLAEGENLTEGVRAFVEKRRPRWATSKL